MTASAHQQVINTSIKASLEIQVNQYNKINFQEVTLLSFNGTAIDTWEVIEQIKLLASSNKWPEGDNGTNPEGSHFDGGATAQINAWNGQTNWNWTQFVARVEAAAGNGGQGLGKLPALANQLWANIELDGITIIDGVVTVHNDDYAAARVSRPCLSGRFSAGRGVTTNQHQPVNNQRRSRQIIDKITSWFTDLARTLWIRTPLDQRPRCLKNVRWEGQAIRADGEYGLYS